MGQTHKLRGTNPHFTRTHVFVRRNSLSFWRTTSNAHPTLVPTSPGLVKATDQALGQGLKFIIFNKLPGDAAVMVHGLSWTSRAQEHSRSLLVLDRTATQKTAPQGYSWDAGGKLQAGLDGVEGRGTAAWCQPRMASHPHLQKTLFPRTKHNSSVTFAK